MTEAQGHSVVKKRSQRRLTKVQSRVNLYLYTGVQRCQNQYLYVKLKLESIPHSVTWEHRKAVSQSPSLPQRQDIHTDILWWELSQAQTWKFLVDMSPTRPDYIHLGVGCLKKFSEMPVITSQHLSGHKDHSDTNKSLRSGPGENQYSKKKKNLCTSPPLEMAHPLLLLKPSQTPSA